VNQLWRWIRRHRKEERGAVLVLTAISMFAVLGAGAMGVDLGFTVYGSRQAQAIADTAAADVIQYITAADQQSSAQALQQTLNTALAGVLKDNNSDANLTVTPMLYQNGTYVVPSGSLGCVARKPPNSAFPVCNAVAIGAQQTVPQPFWGGFNTLSGHAGSGLPVGGGCGTTTSGGCGIGCANYTPCFSCPTGGCTTCPTTACYSVQPQACFSIGTYLANYDTQQTILLNDILDELGGSADITAVGYQGLANTYVTVNQLLAVAGTVLSPTTVMTTQLGAGTWLTLFLDAVENQQQSGMCSSGTSEQTNTEAALNDMSAGNGTNDQFSLCQMISINGSTCNNPSITYADLSDGINVLQALTTAAEFSNGGNGISINMTNALNGLTGVTASLSLQAIEPPSIAYGPVGSVTTTTQGCPPPAPATETCATTSQVDASLSVSVPGYSGISFAVTAASGIATFNYAACAWTSPYTQLFAATTTASAAVALGGQSVVSLQFAGAAQTGFTYSDSPPSSVVPPTAATADPTPPANPSNPRQLGTDDPTPTISGGTALWTLLSPLLAPFDAVLGPLLQAAGVTVGGANVADLGLDCDAIVPTQ
jgi:uncharacterized membrane protein